MAEPRTAWRKFAWHHVRAEVPPDWEVSAYSVEDRAGRIEFNTRRGLEGIVSWEPCKREPDRLTTMAVFLANNIIGKKNAKGLRATDISTEVAGEFLLGWLDDDKPCQAIAYNPASGHIVRWVFEGRANERERTKIMRPILESFDFNADPDACEYILHGIHCRLPWDYKIEDMAALPANAMMSFESEATKRKAIFRRWGLASMIRGEMGLLDFYKPILRSHSTYIDNAAPRRVNGHEALLATFNALREHHSDRFMRRRWHDGKALIWHDKNANRIYTFEQIGPEGTPELDIAKVLPGISIEG